MLLTIILTILTMTWGSFWARQSGGGWLGQYLDKWYIDISWLCESMFILPIALVSSYFFYGFSIISLVVCFLYSYLWMQTGHGTAFAMGRNPKVAQSGRKQTLSCIVDPICKFFGLTLGEAPYCWIFMGLKGLLIGLPLGWFSLLFAVLWPLGYELGYRLPSEKYNTSFPELISGAFAGLIVSLFVIFL